MVDMMDAILLADWGTDLVRSLDSGQRFVLIIVGIGCLTGILLGGLAIISGLVTSIHRRRTEYELKRELVERGMSADEIAKVIECASPAEDVLDRCIDAELKIKKV